MHDSQIDRDGSGDWDEGREEKHSKLYKLNVQGVTIETSQPIVTVRAAMEFAGFDITQAWIIILRTKAEPKKVVTLDTVIDLSDEGVEKLRLTPKQISNGEVRPGQREFALLPVDLEYLERLGVRWDSFVEAGIRWVLIYDYPLPFGFNHDRVNLAVQVPLTYPAAQIDMFYCYPALVLAGGRAIPQTELRVLCKGLPFQRWSRHRPVGGWDRFNDNLISHMALVDEALCREVGQ